MRSPDSDETGEATGGGEALAEGFGTFLDGAGGSDDGLDDGTGFETGFGAGATRDDADTSGLEGLDAAGEPTDAYDGYDAEPNEASDAAGDDYTGDGQGFHEAITSLLDAEAEPGPAAASHDDGGVDLF